ncbi:MAG TPA: WD40 repeat domain-containing protein [Fimbriiglobus sp.]
METSRPLTPPLEHPKEIREASFSPDGRRIATWDGYGTARIWDVEAVNRPDEDLVKFAKLWSASRIDETGSIQPLTPDAYQRLWSELKAKYPAEFDVSDLGKIKSWHTTRLKEADAAKDAFAVAFHLRILLKADPDNTDLKAKLAAAEAQLKPRELAPAPRLNKW